MAYKLTQFGSVIRLSDNVSIPSDPMNSDWQVYRQWVEAGGVPTPADEPTAEELAAVVRFEEAEAFEGLPDWAAYTATEAADAIHDAIFAGATLATVQAQIDAMPATIAGMKAGLKAVVAEIITERGILEKMSKAIVYLRDRT